MNTSKVLVVVGIVLAVAGAIWGVVEVLGGPSQYGTPEAFMRLYPIVIAAAFFSAVIGSAVRLIERRKNLAPLGYLTIVLALVALGAAVRLSFHSTFLGTGETLTGCLWVAAIAAGQVSLLLSRPRSDDRGPAMATAILASLATIGLAVATGVEITTHGSDVSYKLLGILMVAYLLGLVLVPLVSLATRPAGVGNRLE